jgi:hypothetical protein
LRRGRNGKNLEKLEMLNLDKESSVSPVWEKKSPWTFPIAHLRWRRKRLKKTLEAILPLSAEIVAELGIGLSNVLTKSVDSSLILSHLDKKNLLLSKWKNLQNLPQVDIFLLEVELEQETILEIEEKKPLPFESPIYLKIPRKQIFMSSLEDLVQSLESSWLRIRPRGCRKDLPSSTSFIERMPREPSTNWKDSAMIISF